MGLSGRSARLRSLRSRDHRPANPSQPFERGRLFGALSHPRLPVGAERLVLSGQRPFLQCRHHSNGRGQHLGRLKSPPVERQEQSEKRPGRLRRRETLAGRSRFHPVHRPGLAIFGRAAQAQQARLAPANFDFCAADNFPAAEAEPPLVGAVPRMETVEPLQQFQSFFGGDVVLIHGGELQGFVLNPIGLPADSVLGHCPRKVSPKLVLLLIDLRQLNVLVLELALKRFDKGVLENIHDRCHHLRRRIVEGSGNRDPGSESIFRVIANDAR